MMSKRLRTLVALGTLCVVGSLTAVGWARRQEPKPKQNSKQEMFRTDFVDRKDMEKLDLLPPLDEDMFNLKEFIHPLNDPPFNPKDVEAIKPAPHPIPDNPPPHEGAMVEYPIILGPGDALYVTVIMSMSHMGLRDEINRIVMSDGTINLGYGGKVNVAGLTLDQAKKKIVLSLRRIITDEGLGLIQMEANGEPKVDAQQKPLRVAPEDTQAVVVRIASHASKSYYVHGAIYRVGRYPFTGNDTVLDALSAGGGFYTTADTSQIELIRPGPEGKPTLILKIDFDAILHGDAKQNYQVFPGDRIFVPSLPKG